MRFLTVMLFSVACSVGILAAGTNAADEQVVTVESAALRAHRQGPFVGRCEFEIGRLDFLQDEAQNVALLLAAKEDYSNSRRHLLVIISPSVVKALAPNPEAAAGMLLHHRVSVRGKFRPAATEMLYQPQPGDEQYTARVDVTQIDQLNIIEEPGRQKTATSKSK